MNDPIHGPIHDPNGLHLSPFWLKLELEAELAQSSLFVFVSLPLQTHVDSASLVSAREHRHWFGGGRQVQVVVDEYDSLLPLPRHRSRKQVTHMYP